MNFLATEFVILLILFITFNCNYTSSQESQEQADEVEVIDIKPQIQNKQSNENEIPPSAGKESNDNMGFNNHDEIILGVNSYSWQASAKLVSDNLESGPTGEISFYQWIPSEPVMVRANLTKMPQGKHAVHFHAFGDLTTGCKSTGPHLGNLLFGNIEIKEDGKLEIIFHSPFITLFGPRGIVGRSIVIHQKPIEHRRFPDIYGLPLKQEPINLQFKSEEMLVGDIIACGIISITASQHY